MLSPINYEKMTKALEEINFFIGGLSDDGVAYYYNKMKEEGKIQ